MEELRPTPNPWKEMKMKTRTVLIVVAVAALFSGCVQLDPKRAKRCRYVIEVEPPAASKTQGNELTLEISRFGIDPRFADKEFVYRKGNKFESDYYNMFFVSPAGMIEVQTTEWLRAVRPRRFRISPFSRINPDYTLECDISALYGDFGSDRPAAVLGMRVFLAKEAKAGPRVELGKQYRRRIPIEKATPAKLVAGWEKALQEILKDLCNDLER